MQKLTFKQRRFAEEYVNQAGNGTQAALKVYNTTDYNTAAVTATENLKNPNIQRTIEEIAKENGIETGTILKRFNAVSEATVANVSADAKLKATIELAKILSLYPDRKSYQFNLSMKGKIKDLSYKEVQEQLKEVDNTLAELEAEE